jgi:hypothetical protein
MARPILSSGKRQISKFSPQKLKSGSAWYVLVEKLNGSRKRIKGFASESAATKWIAEESAKWMKQQRGDNG